MQVGYQLIRQGAFLVESATDVFEAVPRLERDGIAQASVGHERATPGLTVDGDVAVVLEAMGRTPSHPDDIAVATGLAIEAVLGAVVELEIAGLVVRDESGDLVRMRK